MIKKLSNFENPHIITKQYPEYTLIVGNNYMFIFLSRNRTLHLRIINYLNL